MMEAAVLIISVPFLIFAIILSKGKGAGLIAGYNTMPDSEKEKYDEVALCKFMGRIMYGVSFSIFLLGLSEVLGEQLVFTIGLTILLACVIFALVYINTGNRFKKE